MCLTRLGLLFPTSQPEHSKNTHTRTHIRTRSNIQMPPTKAYTLSHMDKNHTMHALMAVAHTTFMRTHMQMQRSAECYCSSRPLATQERDNSVRPGTGEKLSPAIRMPATTTIEPSEGMSSGHTRTHTLPLWCLFRWVQHVWAAKTEFWFVFPLGSGHSDWCENSNHIPKRAKYHKKRWSRKEAVHQCVPR